MLRNVVRQELVTRQLARHLPPAPARCWTSEPAKARRRCGLPGAGFSVVAAEPDAAMRSALAERLAAAPEPERHRVTTVDAGTYDLAAAAQGRTFDVVLCHGVLMYLPEPGPVAVELSDLVAPGGVLSLLSRNADGMALRPGAAPGLGRGARPAGRGALAQRRTTSTSSASGRAPTGCEELASTSPGGACTRGLVRRPDATDGVTPTSRRRPTRRARRPARRRGAASAAPTRTAASARSCTCSAADLPGATRREPGL